MRKFFVALLHSTDFEQARSQLNDDVVVGGSSSSETFTYRGFELTKGRILVHDLVGRQHSQLWTSLVLEMRRSFKQKWDLR